MRGLAFGDLNEADGIVLSSLIFGMSFRSYLELTVFDWATMLILRSIGFETALLLYPTEPGPIVSSLISSRTGKFYKLKLSYMRSNSLLECS